MASPAQEEKNLILRVICSELGRASYKWFKIGIQLGIPHHVLKRFEKEDDPLSAAVNYWLQGNVQDPAIPISWTSIVAALRSDSIEEAALAREISKKFCEQDSLKVEKATDDCSTSSGEKMDPDVKMDLEYILETNLKEIIAKYASYVDCLRAAIEEKGVSPTSLCTYLLSLPAFSGQALTLMSDKKSELQKAETVPDIFCFLTTECASFLDYEVFQYIMRNYDISEDQERLKYTEHLKAYVEKHKISEFVKVNPLLKSKKGYKELIVKYDVETTCRLGKVVNLKKFIAKMFGLLPSALDIVDIKEGCVIVTFYIPTSVADAIFTPDKVLTSEQVDELRAGSVLWLECNGHMFNFEKEVHTESQALKKLKEQLTCSICLGTYTNPKLLQCNHTYCQPCLMGLLQQEELTLTCPICRNITPVPANGVADLQSDFRVNQLLDIVGENWKETVTAGPEKIAASSEASSEAVAIPVSETATTASSDVATVGPEKIVSASSSVATQHEVCCSEHFKEVHLFCHTCGESICLKCAMKGGAHESHNWEELDEAFKKHKEGIPSSLAKMKKALAQLDARCGEISDQRAVVESDIHSTILPDVRKTELIGQLHQLTQAKLKNLGAQRDQIETAEIHLNKVMKDAGDTLWMKSTTVKQLHSTLQPQMLKPSEEASMKLSDLVDITAECQKFGLVSENPTDPSKCYVTGKAKAELGKSSTAVLHAKDSFNQPCKILNMNSITCHLVSEIAGTTRSGSIRKKGESQYDISFQPTIKGGHQLHIKIKGQHIKGSPFHINTKSPVKEDQLGIPIRTTEGAKTPTAVAVNRMGEMVVAEGGQCVIYSPTGERVRSFDTLRSGLDSVGGGVAVDREGNIFVADPVDHCIRKFTAQGDPLAEAIIKGDGSNKLYPYGVAYNASNGMVYTVSNTVYILFSSDLKLHSSFEGGHGHGSGLFIDAKHIACDIAGDVYVADHAKPFVHQFTATGQMRRMIGNLLPSFTLSSSGSGGKLDRPYGVAVDANGRVYISEVYDHRVSVFALTGKFVASFGSEGRGPGQFRSPRGLAVDGSGVFYVCDSDNGRIQLF